MFVKNTKLFWKKSIESYFWLLSVRKESWKGTIWQVYRLKLSYFNELKVLRIKKVLFSDRKTVSFLAEKDKSLQYVCVKFKGNMETDKCAIDERCTVQHTTIYSNEYSHVALNGIHSVEQCFDCKPFDW